MTNKSSLRFASSAALIFGLISASCAKEDPAGPGTPGPDAGPSDGAIAGADAGVFVDGDGDGLPDDWEAEVGLDPTRDDAAEDPDGDSQSNRAEYTLGTHPFDIDSDDDGALDGEEDSNHDGVHQPTESHPARFDTDDDGLSDGQELGIGRPRTSPRPGVEGTDPAVFVADINLHPI